MSSTGLTLDNLTLPKEKTYLGIIAVIAGAIWLLLLCLIFPIFFGLGFALLIWLANGLLIARLKSESVKVSDRQLPELNAVFKEVCKKLQCNGTPELYVLQSGGTLNAFATRHSGRNFVVLYSDMVEAYGVNSDEIKFILGHEIGHIHRNHLLKLILLGPGLWLPLVGHAYSRACEASCDRYGAYATENIDGALRAMMKLSGGKEAARAMNPDCFAEQYHQDRGFFISWHELISGYPTLSQRMANLVAIRDNTQMPRAGRNPLAYLFAFFSMGSSTSGGGGLLTTIFVIALMAGLALPAIEGAQKKAREVQRQAELHQQQQSLLDEKSTPANPNTLQPLATESTSETTPAPTATN